MSESLLVLAVFPGPLYPVDWTLDTALRCLRPESLHNILSLGSGRPLVITKQIIRLVMIEARKQYPINYRHKGQQHSVQRRAIFKIVLFSGKFSLAVFKRFCLWESRIIRGIFHFIPWSFSFHNYCKATGH